MFRTLRRLLRHTGKARNFVLSTGDVISTYIYRISLGGGGKFELSTAANLLLNLLGMIALIWSNRFVKKMDVMGII